MTPAFADSGPPSDAAPLSVSQLNREVANVLENAIPLVWVRGEVSNFLCAASGHWYFTLKDAGAAVRSVMFRGRASQVGFVPRAGDRVEVRARVSLYEPRGDFQLQVQAMRRAGQGDLFEAFLRLKERLAGEGLLDAQRKRALPTMPRAIGVVTSLHAAALRDVLSALARRAPHVPVIVYPAPVQGADAAPRLLAALDEANRRREVDVVLLVRGGGSIEDLWSFNDEALARAVAASPLPVVCGVGHESDFTICDFVADVRAPTPTAAAELACCAREEAWQRVRQAAAALALAQQRRLERLAQRLDHRAAQLVSPAQRLARQRDRLDALSGSLGQVQAWRLSRLAQRLDAAAARLPSPGNRIARDRERLEVLALGLRRHQAWQLGRLGDRLTSVAGQLRALGPNETLARGYAIVRDAEGRVVRDAASLAPGASLAVDLERGRAIATVERTEPDAAL